jgi:hypothetical protein
VSHVDKQNYRSLILKERWREQTPADHAMYAAFWQFWLAQLEGGFISRVASGVAAC